MRVRLALLVALAAVAAPGLAQDQDGLEGPLGNPETAARFGMAPTGNQYTAAGGHYAARFPGYRYFSYVGQGTNPKTRCGMSQWPACKYPRFVHRFRLVASDGQAIPNARFKVGVGHEDTLFALEHGSDSSGELALRLRKPRKSYQLHIDADGYRPLRYDMGGGKLRSAEHTITLQPVTGSAESLVELAYRPTGPKSQSAGKD